MILIFERQVMSQFDPSALTESPQDALDAFFVGTIAPGVQIEVTRRAITVEGAVGIGDVTEGTPMQSEQIVEVGSQTKMMIGVVVLQLAAEGKIDLDLPLSCYVDHTVTDGVANADTATIRQMLANRSGIPDFDEVPGSSGAPEFLERLLLDPTTPIGPDALLDIARDVPSHFEPGAGYRYSNTDYLLLGELIETITGKSVGDVLQERIFVPTGMTQTKLDPTDRQDGRAHSYTDIGDGALTDVTLIPLDFGAAGGVVSTTSDMIRFLDALLVSQTLLSQEWLEQMTNFLDADGASSLDGNGLGLSSNTINGQQFIGFQGGTLGTNTGTVLHVQSGTIISVAATHSGADPSELLLDAFHRVLIDDLWAEFDPDVETIEINGTAAGVELTEVIDVDGSTETQLVLDQAKLTLDGPISDFDADRFEFADKSSLWIGGRGQDIFDVTKDAIGSAHSDNQILGLAGRDVLLGGYGDDKLLGGNGADHLSGRSGDDVLVGGKGKDSVLGGSGNDTIEGGRGRDQLFGGAGNDHLVGGAGKDRLIGGEGADTFAFSSGDGKDRIVDFDSSEDVLDFSLTGLAFDDLDVRYKHFGAVVSYGQGDAVLLLGCFHCLEEDSFIF